MWADKFAILLVTLVFLFLFAIADNRWGLLGPDCWSAWAEMFLIVWVPLRLIDWLLGGPARRAARRPSHPSASAVLPHQDGPLGI